MVDPRIVQEAGQRALSESVTDSQLNPTMIEAIRQVVLQVLQQHSQNNTISQATLLPTEQSNQVPNDLSKFAKLVQKLLFPFYGNTINSRDICDVVAGVNIARMLVDHDAVSIKFTNAFRAVADSDVSLVSFGQMCRASVSGATASKVKKWFAILKEVFHSPVVSADEPKAKLLGLEVGRSAFGQHSANPSWQGLPEEVHGITGDVAHYFFTKALKAHKLDDNWKTNTPETTNGYRLVSFNTVYSPL